MSTVQLGVNGLQPGFKYNVRVRGIFNGAAGQWSPTEEIDLFSDTSSGTGDKAPANPTNFTVTPTVDSFILTWTAPTQNVDGTVLKDMKEYVIEVRPSSYAGSASAVYTLPEVQNPSLLDTVDREKTFEFTYKMNKELFGGSGNAGPYFTLYSRDTTNNKSTGSQQRQVNASPSAPTSLTATAVPGGASVVWSGGTSGDIVSYVLKYSTSNGFDPAATGTVAYQGPLTTYSFSGTAGTPYYFRVGAVDIFGQTAWFATQATATPGAGGITYATPNAPTSLVESYVGANYRVAWTASSSPAQDVKHYRVEITANTLKTYYTTDNFIDIDPQAGKDFGANWPYTATLINVYAVGPTGLTSSALNKSSAFATAPATPTAPTLTTALGTGAQRGIDVTWTAPSDPSSILEAVEVYAGTAASPTTTAYTGRATAFNYQISPTFNGTYYFRSRVKDVYGRYSAYSADASRAVTTLGATTVGTVTGALDTADTSNRTGILNVTWTNPSSQNYAGTKLRYRVNGTTNWTIIDVGNTTSTLIRNLVPGVAYNLDIIAYDFNGTLGNSGTWTSFANQTVAADTTKPANPTSVTLSTGATSLMVKWTNPSDADYINSNGRAEVQISTSGTFASDVTTKTQPGGVAAAVSAESFTGLTPSTTYYARVRVLDASGNENTSGWIATSPASIAVGSAGNPSDGNVPTGTIPTPTAISGIGGIHVRWTAMSNADVLSYEVHVGTTAGFTASGSTLIGTVTGTYFFAKVDGAGADLAYATNYYFKLRPFDVDGPHASYGPASGAAQVSRVSGTTDITDGTIQTAKLVDGAVTAAKLGAAIGGGNLLANSSFELDANADGVANDWTAATSGTITATNTISTAEKVYGASSQRLNLAASTTAGYRTIQQSGTMPAGAITKLTLSFWYKGSRTGTGQFNPVLSNSGVTSFVEGQYTPTATWQRGSITWTVPGADTTWKIDLRARAYAISDTIDLYLDGVQLEVGDVVTSYAPKPDEILDGSIVAAKIAANTITANQIAANTITSAEINADAITASELAAGAVTANKLSVIVGGGNLITNSSFEAGQDRATTPWTTGNPLGWSPGTNATFTSITGRIAGTKALRHTATTGGNVGTNRATFTISPTPLDINTKYTLSAWVRRQSGTGELHFAMDGLTSGALTSGVSGTWARYSTTITTGGTAPSPLALYNNIANDVFDIDDVQLEIGDVATAYAPRTNEILPGTITAGLVAADTITANEIATDAITTNELAANAVTAGNIAAGTIVASDISAAGITTDKLAVGGASTNLIKPEYASFQATPALYGSGKAFELTADGATPSVSTNFPKFGTQSAQVTTSGANQGFYLGKTITDYNVPVTAAKNYIVSAYVYSTTGATATIRLKADDGSFITPSAISGATSWTTTASTSTRVYGTFTIPAGRSAVLPTIQFGAAGTFYVDGFMMEERVGALSTSPATTGGFTPSSFMMPQTTIDGASIVTGTLNADRIESGTITTTQLSSGNIDGGVITAGTISAGKLSIGSGANMVPAQYAAFEWPISPNNYYTGKLAVTGTATATVVAGNQWNGLNSLKIDTTSATNEVFLGTSSTDYNIPVKASTTYIISAYIKAASGAPTVKIRAKGNVAGVLTPTPATVTLTTGYVQYSAIVTTGASDASMLISFADVNTVGAQTIYVDGVMVEQRLGANAVASSWVPGASTSIDGGGITTNSLDAAALKAGTAIVENLTLGDATDGVLTVSGAGGKIKSNNYSPGASGWQLDQNGLDIQDGTINAANVAVTNIDAANISTGFLSAARINTDTITSAMVNTAGIAADKVQVGGRGRNLIPNQYADFENNSTGTFWSGKFTTTNVTATIASGAGNFNTGAQSLSANCTSTTTPSVYLAASATDYNFTVSGSKKYIVSAWIKAPSAGQSVTFKLTGNSTSPAGVVVSLSSGTTWNRYSAVITMGANDTKANLSFTTFTATGVYLIDSVMVEEQVGNQTTPSTFDNWGGTIIDGNSITTGTVKTDRVDLGLFNSNLLENGSFEKNGSLARLPIRYTAGASSVSIPGWTLSRVAGDTTSSAYYEWGSKWSEKPNKVLNGDMQDQQDAITCLLVNTSDSISAKSHGLAAGTAVIFKTLDNTTYGLSVGTVYYVSATSLATDTFRVAATPGGAAITLTGDTAGTYVSGAPVGYSIVSNGTHGGYVYNQFGSAASLNYKFAETFPVTGRLLEGNTAVLFFADNANVLNSETIDVSDIDATFNGSYNVSGSGFNSDPYSIEILSYSGTSTVGTVTTTSRHYLKVGDIVRIEGVDQQGSTFWDGIHRVASVADSSFTYEKPTGGTVTTPSGAFVYINEYNTVSYPKTATSVSYAGIAVPGRMTYGKSALLGLSGSTTAGAYYGLRQTIDLPKSDTVTKATLSFWYKVTGTAKMTAVLGNTSFASSVTSSLQTATSWTKVNLEYTVAAGDTQVIFDIRAVAEVLGNTGTVFVDGVQLIYGTIASDLQEFDAFYSQPARSGLAKVILQKSASGVNGTQLVSDPVKVDAGNDYAIGMYYYGDMGVGLSHQLEYSASLPFSTSATYNLNMHNRRLPETISSINAEHDVSSWFAKAGGYVRLVVKNATTSPNGGAGSLYIEDCWFMKKGSTSGELTDAGIRLFDSNGSETLSLMSDSSDGGDFIQLGSGIYLDGPKNTISTSSLVVESNFTLDGQTIDQILSRYPRGIIARGSRVSQGTTTAGVIRPYLEVQADNIDWRRAYRIWTSPVKVFNSNGAAAQVELTIRYDSSNPANKPVTSNFVVASTRVQGNNNFNYQFGHLERYWSPSPEEVALGDGTFRFLLCYQGFGTTAADSIYINGSTTGEYVQLNIEDMGLQVTDIGIDRGADGDSNSTERTYTKTFKPLWVGSYREGGQILQNNYIYQGDGRDYGNEKSAVAFDTSTIPDGATIKKVEAYLYCYNSALSYGVNAVIGLHKDPGRQAPDQWSGIDGASTVNIVKPFSKKEGNWIDITTLSARFSGLDKWSASGVNRYTGITIGPGTDSQAKYSGAFVGKSGKPPSGGLLGGFGKPVTNLYPKLRVTYSVSA
jgi:hypothetical protein